ncbi:major facilitator superfamily domain-containing protein [Auriculariales sp. MPI-PUGE-AT-0066]|nr:major facilitator superfamily domain-containing protein [Auriculariales sp. MPI-PUGE-AT-0066]
MSSPPAFSAPSIDEKQQRPSAERHEPMSETASQDATLAPHEEDSDHVHAEEIEVSGVKIPADWETDPENPQNWSFGQKWVSISIVSLYTLVAPLASSMLAPGLKDMAKHFDITSITVVNLVLSIFLLGFAIGPLIFGPLSEMYGRRIVLHISTAVFFVFNLVSIWAPNTAAICVFRFFAGLGGSAAVGIGGGCVADVFKERERAQAMGIYTLGPLLGPVIGPIAGGFLADAVGYKWIFVVITILAGISLAAGIPLLRETYAPFIIEQRARRRIKDEEARGDVPEKAPAKANLSHVLWLNISRPFILLTRSLICFTLAAYMGLNYGIMYLMFATFPTTFHDIYGFGTNVSGLAYLGLGVGFFGSTLIGARIMNNIYLRLAKQNKGVAEPEFRLPLMILASVIVPIGLLIYGWTAREGVHWIVPIIGTAIFALGVMLSFLAITLYLVDSFTYAASAIAAASFLRSMFGFAFPLFAVQMFDALKTGPGNSLLAGVAVVLGVPFPIWLYYRGAQARARSSLMRR